MLRRVGSALGVVLCLTGLLSGCSGKPIVGVVLPTTGAAASYGESIESGIRFSVIDSRIVVDQVMADLGPFYFFFPDEFPETKK